MSDTIKKLTATYVIDYDDLMKYVDDVDIDMQGVVQLIQNSRIPVVIWKKLLRCQFLADYIRDSRKPYPVGEDVDRDQHIKSIHYLRLYQYIDIDRDDVDSVLKVPDRQLGFWYLDGVGQHYFINPYDPTMGRGDLYGIDFIPAAGLRNRPVVIDRRMPVSIHRDKYRVRHNFQVTSPGITLLQFLYRIFWQVTWHGSDLDKGARWGQVEQSKDERQKELEELKKNDQPVTSKFSTLNDLMREMRRKNRKNALKNIGKFLSTGVSDDRQLIKLIDHIKCFISGRG